eukprot:6185639-Pleurochrysis_carterae.AAC.1
MGRRFALAPWTVTMPMAAATVATRACLLVPFEFRRGALGVAPGVSTLARRLVPFEFRRGALGVALDVSTRARLLRLAWLFHFGLGFGEQCTPIWAVKFEIALDLPRLR